MFEAADANQGSKAYKLCLAFECLCRSRRKRTTRKEMVEIAENVQDFQLWELLCEQQMGVRKPSPQTVGLAIGILRARAGLPAYH
jgi:hypothetical protein